MLFQREDGRMRDRRIHLGLIEKGKNKRVLKDKNLERLTALGMPEDDAKKALAKR